jgi:SH3-like domain-containing protein
MSKKHYSKPEAQFVEEVVDVVEDIVEEPKVEEVVAPQPIGKVVECGKLNVRQAPVANAAVACTITRDTEIVVDLGKSTDEWYRVCTEAGIEGYCMKKYISVSK